MKLLLFLPILTIAQFTSKTPFPSSSLPLSDQCFCKLEGQIDDCSCKVDTVDHFNNAKVYPRLASLLAKDYFRYFYYQPFKPCPFWEASSGKCSSSLCQVWFITVSSSHLENKRHPENKGQFNTLHMKVKSCPTTDLPPGISGDVVEAVEKEPEDVEESSCVEEHRSSVDSSITEGELVSLSTWRRHDEADSTFCELDSPSSCIDCVYVDLTKNPERYTGYSGQASRRVWASIYEENCFSPLKATTKPPAFSSAFGQTQLVEMCLEKRVFYRVVSGLHASITIHLAANYPLENKKDPAAAFLPGSGEAWGPNMELFHQRFDPEHTEGQGPYWLKNLYFVYLLELRALAKASDYLSRQTYFTGRQEEDKETLIAVKELLSLISSFKDHFDETSMFAGGLQADVSLTFPFNISESAWILVDHNLGAESGVPRAFPEHITSDGLCWL